MWGAVRENLRRSSSPAYADGIASPASVCVAEQRKNNTCAYSQEYSGYGSTRPSPRMISNVLFRQTESIISERRINDFHVHFGQVSSVKTHFSEIRKTMQPILLQKSELLDDHDVFRNYYRSLENPRKNF